MEQREIGKDCRNVRFGLGEVISDKATIGGYPAVTLEPSNDAPGIVGARGPDLPLDKLRDGSVVLSFHERRGAEILIEDIAISLHDSGINIGSFLRGLAETLESKQGGSIIALNHELTKDGPPTC